VLRARRTWRRLSHRPLSDSDLSTLLGLTFGVQRTIDGGALGAGPLKTSPSGGGRHPIEAYVVVRNVAGVQPGIYHYEPYAHRLACLKPHASSRTIRAYLPQQPWYGRAGALIVMSAVFARAEWQYQYPRTYRAIAMETGHFCQTFCLVATALGLAPFCSDALDDRLVERDLGIDGVREAVLYAAGVGTRPRGSTWEPWPDEWLADPKFARAVGQPAVRTSKTRTRRVLPPSGGAGR
jgi:SagB-type dehydrogenase family enzyme